MTDNLVNHINNIIPIDYFNKDYIENIITTLVSTLIPIIQTKPVKQRKELQKKMLTWSNLVKNDDLDNIFLDNEYSEQLEQVIKTQILEDIEKSIVLTQGEKDVFILLKNNQYHYLYLIQFCIPIVYELFDIQSLIDNEPDFIAFCFSLNIFDRNDTIVSIQDKYRNHFYEFLDNFIYCIEEYKNINIVCISLHKFGQKNSNVLKSMISERNFLINRPTLFLYYDKDNLFKIIFYNISINKLLEYNDIKTQYSDLRLKRLLKVEYEKVDLDKLVIRYEPTDIGRKLPVINLTINDKTIKCLVGSTYNLYLYSHDDIITEKNILIGKIDIININGDDKVGKGNIYWIEGYQDLL